MMEDSLGATLAAVNALLNGSSAVMLIVGYIAIKRGDRETHMRAMIGAFVTSILFLISYLTRFYLTGVHRFPGEGTAKTVYLLILGSHTVLAAITPVLSIRSIYLAYKSRLEEHRRLSKWTFPIWLYVSVTGVVVYWMLYQMNFSSS